MASYRSRTNTSSRNQQQFEANENESENPANPVPFPHQRSPLNLIQDPSQCVGDEYDSRFRPERLGRFFPEKKNEALDYYGTPRAVQGKSHSEPNSAQSTPVRSISRVSNLGSSVGCVSNRPPHHTGTKGGNFSRVSRAISAAAGAATPWPAVEVPHFELLEDSSFWMDHNVQVLIRIRPISSMERTLQGYTSCLRQENAQTLTWLGHPETRFTFDHIACETISQEKLFRVAGLPMVENCMSGYNSCMFAYGQTGSGKTYTMMGDIREIDDSLSVDCGMTPRIFEYLFMRSRAEEENRRDERLKYSCKCSFIEIYNEQITDLLEPSSTNLQLREDMKKGVYVENLKEFEVINVKDVVRLLLQGAANRKVAATYMNSESSRSHSVFTCIVESRWEKDSMTHFRFGRLNLVDLAGSERQKSSGAEGERLKEAANINKSLSTLGLVIMTLVDVAHGKHRHVPYRDSRLTFLLQDSLGGNSKTTIIANVSPSICSANETLSTLKFAQRAKLIQNNAKVNEDASGDVIALQQQIHQLKAQLTFLLKHQNVSRPLSCPSPYFKQANLHNFVEEQTTFLEENVSDAFHNLNVSNKKVKNLEAALVGALRREKMAEAAVRRLEAEIEHMSRLVNQREEDAQRTKMLLRFREEKIRRLNLLPDGLISADEFLMEENVALSEEIHMLQEKIDRHPELTRFALENIRLLEQLRMFQDFYEQGQRETLLDEISNLRDQILEILNDGQAKLSSSSASEAETKLKQAAFSAVQGGEMLHTKADNTLGELEECKKHLASCLEANTKLTSEVDDLRHQLNFFLNSRETNFDKNEQYSFSDHPKKEANELSSVELTLARMNSEERLSSCKEVREKLLKIQKDHMDAAILEPRDAQKELLDVKYLVEAMESQQIHLIEELDNLKQKNYQYLKLLRSMGHGDCKLLVSQGKMGKLGNQEAEQMVECGDMTKLALQTKLLLLHSDLVEAKILNRQYKDDQASQLLNHHELEQVQEEVEVETAKTIIYLQGELAALQQEVDSKNTNESSAMRHSLLLRTENQELQERLCTVARENIQLKNAIAVKEDEIKALTSEWEKATFDLTDFLVDGIQSLEDASYQSEGIVNLFSQRKPWIGERVERAVRVFIEKEQTIEQLQKKLEAAQKMGLEMKLKLNSLKGATIAITEVQQLEKNENFKEVNQLRTLLSDKLFTIHELEGKLENMEQQMTSAENRANAAFIAIKRPYEMNDFKPAQRNVTEVLMNVHSTESLRKNDSNRSMESKFSEPTPHVYSLINHVDEENCDLKFVSSLEQDRSQNIYVDTSSHALGEIGAEVEMARRSVMESENAICTSYVDTEKYLSALLSDILDTSSEVRQMVQDLINDVCNMKKKFMKLKEQNKRISCLAPESPSSEVCETRKINNEYSMACLLRSAIIKTNEKLDIIRVSIDTLCNVHGCSIKVGDPTVAGLDLLACRFCKRSCSQPEHAAFYSDHGLERKTKSVSSVDYCISAFDHSPIEKDSEYEMGESFSSISSIGYSRRLEEQNWDIFTQRDLACACSGHDMAESQLPLGDSFCNDTDALYLREEVESAISSLMRIYRHLCKLLVNKGVATHSFPEKMDICESLECGTDDHQLNTDNKEEFNQLAIPEVGLMLQKLEQRMEEAEVGCCEAREICLKLSDARLVAEEKIKQTNNLLLKYEEAQETMKEADLMINKLLRVNENAKNKTNGLKEACKELMTEKASLIEEVQWLKASMQLKDEQSESLQDQFLMVLVEVAESMSSLEGAFLQMWKNLEEELKLLYSEFFNLRQELLDSIGTSRTWLEYIWSEAMEKGFSWFVLYQCHIGAFLEKLASFNSDSSFSKYRHNESGSAHGNVGNICMNAEIDDLKLIQMNEAEKVVNRKLLPHGLSVSVHAEQTLHASQTVQNLVGSLMNSAFVSYEKPDLQLGLKYFWERFVKLEEEKLALSHDMNSVKEIVTEQLVFLESFCQELTSLKEISGSEESDHLVRRLKPEIGATVAKALHSNGSISPDTNCSSVSKVFGFPSFRTQNPVTGLVVEDNEVTETELGGETIDRNTLFAGIQNLKALCAQMISLVAEKKGCSELAPWHKQDMHAASNDLDNCMLEYVQEREVGHLNCPQMRTECGHNLIQEMKKFIYMISYLKDYTHSGTAKRFGASFLELFQGLCCIEEQVCGFLGNSSEVKVDQTDHLLLENLSLKRELARKEYLLEGLLFDVRLLQESTSNIKDIKDESEEMVAALSKIQHELVIKTNDLDDILVQHRELEVRLAERETALSTTRSELEQATEALDLLSNDNNDLRILLEDLYVKKTNVEEQLEEKAKVVKGLEKEILCLTNSVEERVHTSVAEVDDKLRSVSDERDLLHAEIVSLNEKLEMANALADENEAIAVEARQVSEANKIYAEQKEEEVKILEHSIEELESTINVLERKVYEMGEEVERHRVMREDLELELQALRERMLTVKNATENNPAIEEVIEDQMSRKIDDRILELLEAKKYIKVLENDKADQAKEIKQCKEYISELLLHAEAQASQYQQKYKTLEAMVREAKTDLSTSNPSTSTLRTDKSSIKPRGSGSPFKCIASLVQQMNSEKDQELSVARQRIEKLEGLAATRQKEVCMLNARLLATESMTHDVIRDLLGVKLDMTNYANLIDQQHIQKLAEKAQHRTEECQTKEQEIVRLRKQINDLTEERESWIEEIKQRQAYILATQVTVEQLQQRDQLLTMQNEMLKMDKTNLKKKVAELDEMVKKLFGSQGIKNCAHEPTKIKESNFFRVGNEEFAKRLAHSEKLLSHVNRELSWYRKSNGKDPYIKTDANDRLNSKEKDAEFDRGLSS